MDNMIKVFDLHCDTIPCLCKSGGGLVNTDLQLSIDRPSFESYAQTFAIYVPDELHGQAAIDYYEENYAYFMAQMQQYSAKIAQVKTPAELKATLQDGKIAAILAVEGGCALGGELSRIRTMKAQGVSFLTLTWNGENELGSGTYQNKGLTGFGREAIAEMESCGMVADVSHLADAGFDDILKVAKKPFIATHSNSRTICNVPRNLRDDQFCEIVKRGGLVGINFYIEFLRENDIANTEFSDILKHIEHFLKLGGENVLALGSDYDGADIDDELNSIEKIAKLYEFMLQSLTDKRIVDKIFFENANNFFTQAV